MATTATRSSAGQRVVTISRSDLAQAVGALGRRDGRHRAVHRDRHERDLHAGLQVVERHRDPVVELAGSRRYANMSAEARALADDRARERRVARDAVLGQREPLVEPVGGADVLVADADRVLRHVVDRPVQQVIVASMSDDVGPRRLEPAAQLAVAVEHELPVRLGRAVEPAGEPGAWVMAIAATTVASAGARLPHVPRGTRAGRPRAPDARSRRPPRRRTAAGSGGRSTGARPCR